MKRVTCICLAIFIALSPTSAQADFFRKFVKVSGGTYLVYKGAKTIKKGIEIGRKVAQIKDGVEAAYKAKNWTKVAESIRDDIIFATRFRITPSQFKSITEHLVKNGGLKRIDAASLERARKAFDTNKDNLIKDWVKATGKPWPSSANGIRHGNGSTLGEAGSAYQAHHIIPLELGGQNAWWNIVPAEFPGMHQFGLHGTGSVLSMLGKLL